MSHENKPQDVLPTHHEQVNPVPSKLEEERLVHKPTTTDAEATTATTGKKRDREGEEKEDLEKHLETSLVEEGKKEEEKVDLEKKDDLVKQDQLERPSSKKPKLDEEAKKEADAAANKAAEAPVELTRQEQVASNE